MEMKNNINTIRRTVSIVIPVYNENEIILKTIKECLSCLKEIDHEIIIVDDGSLDGTYEKVQKFANRYQNIKIVNYRDNHGKGFAVRYGAKHATGNLVAFIDADMNIHPKQILTLIKEMERTDADIIIGSKRHRDSKVNYPLNRTMLSELYYLFVKILFGLPVRDTQVGLKLYRRKILEEICPMLLVKRYAFDIEILANAHRLGYNIGEAPVEINMSFDSHVNKRAVWNMFVDTCAIFYRMKIIHFYDKKIEVIKNEKITIEFEKKEDMENISIKVT